MIPSFLARAHRAPMRTTASSRAFGALLLGALALSGCRKDKLDPQERAPLTLQNATPSADTGSCSTCHPRQFREWAGSSHNYGQGLDPGYQSLEITGNYYARYRFQRPVFRQTVLCVTCHAPTAGGYQTYPDGIVRLNPNAGLRPPADGVGRDLREPTNDEGLLEPPGRAAETLTNPAAEMEEVARHRRLAFEGITCDTCHKTGRPFDDLQDDLGAPPVCSEKTPACAARIREQCLIADDPRCRRITRDQSFGGPDRFDFGIANFALSYQRSTPTRFGPFPVGHVATNIAHDVSSGETPEAQNYHVEFAGQAEDVRPYIKTSQFCGACHDVRLGADNALTPEVEREPIHDEPFIRLENLYTEFYRSPLNLFPGTDPRDNPFVDDNGDPRRIVCQDCHMSLFPYAPPGTFPGEYTASDAECDAEGRCGPTIALAEIEGKSITTNNLKVVRRPRVTTHYMTGVDVALGHLAPEVANLDLESLPAPYMLPYQTNPVEAPEPKSPDYDLPVTLDARREQQLKNAVTVSLAGTPETVDPEDRDCSDGLCCDEEGDCNLPVKAWLMNINGGHNVAAGFSQERQVWVELTVQDLGRMNSAGFPKVVDCSDADASDFYTQETLANGRYPRWSPRSHDALGATDLLNRMFGIVEGRAETEEEREEHQCRGMSGHLIDKPHFETHEPVADGRLDDEDILLHRIGNTLPELEDGRHLVSWHVLDYGLNQGAYGADPVAGRVDRADQFHTIGNDVYTCELSKEIPNAAVANYPLTVYDPVTGATSTVATGSIKLKHRVTDTSDERLEILYPFPEFKTLLPTMENGHLHPGERFGLAYPTNVFYRVCGCPIGDASCNGPETIPGVAEVPAQMPWLKIWPTLPHRDFDGDKWFLEHSDRLQPALDALGMPTGSPAGEAFTFIPFNSNHMPNNRSLVYFKPQRHYWDIRFKESEVVGPLRVHVKVWYRHFPPEFLRLMARSTEALYRRAEALGKAAELFPNGPLMNEGTMSAMHPNAGGLDRVKRFMLDEAVTMVAVNHAQESDPRVQVPANPTYSRDIAPIVADNCLPCHNDVLRHGRLVLSYDQYPQWDDPLRGPKAHEAQDPTVNLTKSSFYLKTKALVTPGDPDGSFLMDVLTKDKPDPDHDRVRRMPLKMDKLSNRDIETIRRWIQQGAQK